MIKRILTITVIFILTTFSLYSSYTEGSAAGFFFRFSFPAQASLGATGKFEGIPVMFGGIFNIGISTTGWSWFGLSASADYLAYEKKLGRAGESDAYVYIAPGVELITEFGNNYWNIEAAFRLPIGFSFIVDRDWEIFLQPTPGISLISAGSRGFGTFGWYPSYTGWTFATFFRFSGDFGFRYWF